jgi:hypothetical protein
VESRGAHQRLDAPAPDLGLDGMHAVVERDERLEFEHWR